MFSLLRRRPSAQTPSTRRRKTQVRPRIEDLEGKILLTAIPINFGATVTSAPVAIGSELFFVANDATHGKQLWGYTASSGAVRLTDGNDVNGGINPQDLTAAGSTLYFAANDPALGGAELWKSGGTPANSVPVSNVKHGCYPSDLTPVGNAVYFAGFSLSAGAQVWKSNASGTQMVTDIAGPGGYPGCYPTDLTNAGGVLYFAATDATHGQQLWATNPTSGATTMLTSGNAGVGRGTLPQDLTAVGSTLYFSGFDPTNKSQLWYSGGTPATTARLSGVNTGGNGLNPEMLTAAGNTLFFSGGDGVHGAQLWEMSGTTYGTATMLTSTDASGGGVSPTNLAAVGNTLYFSGEDASYIRRLWSSDGTTTGTKMVPGGTACSDPGNLTAVSGLVYFTGCALGSYQVWQSNGTSVVKDTGLATGGGLVPSDLAGMSSDLYFLAPGATVWEWKPASTTLTTSTTNIESGAAAPAAVSYGTLTDTAPLTPLSGPNASKMSWTWRTFNASDAPGR